MKLDELFVALGFKVDDKDLKKVEGTLNDVKKSALGFKIAIGAVAFGLSRMISNTIQGTAELEKFSQTTGLAIDKLLAWQEAGQKIDLTLGADTIKNSIVSLQKNLDEIKLGRGDIGAFQILGVDIAGKDAFQVLENLRSALGNVDNSVAKNLIGRMGLDPSFLTLLKTSRNEFEALGKQIQLTANQRNDMLTLGKSFREIKLNAISLKNQIAASLAPAINKLSQAFLTFYKKNVKEIMAFVKTFGNIVSSASQVISNGFKVIVNVLSPVYNALKNILGLEGAIILFGAILVKAFSPFRLAMVSLFLILDDIAVWLSGGASLFGNFYQTIADGIKVIQPLIDKVLELKKALNDKQEVKNYDDLQDEGLLNKGKRYGSSALSGAVGGGVVGTFIPGVGTVAAAIVGALVGLGKELYNDIELSKPHITQMQKQVIERRGIEESGQQNGGTQNNNINITQNITGNNADEIAKKVINGAGAIVSENMGSMVY